MKIAMLETGGWGGLWHYTCCLSEALFHQGLDVKVITKSQFEKPFDCHFTVVPIIEQNARYVSQWNRIFHFIRNENPQLLHIQSWFSARRDWFPFTLLNMRSMPLVITAHNLLPHDKQERNAPFMFFSYKAIYRTAAKLIVHSHANKEKLMRTFQLSDRKIEVVRHGNYLFFSDQYPTDPMTIREQCIPTAKKSKIFLLFGAMRQYKGIDLALKAFGLLSNRQAAHLIVAGKPYGLILSDLKRMADEMHLSDHVTFFPDYLRNEDVARLHAMADVVLFPYRDIFQSGSLQIALAFGKPIIASRVGSFPETLNPMNARLVQPDSVEDLARAMEHMLVSSDIDLRRMGLESKRIAKDDHDWSDISRQTKHIYLNILQG